MVDDRGLAGLYRDSMRLHRFGYALYEPVPFSRLRPGALGYLDEYQRWHPILDLADAEAVQAAGYPPVGYLQPSGLDVRRFGPLTSSGTATTGVELEAGVGATAFGLPVDVSCVLKYSTPGDFGAVLMCDSDVVSEGFDFRDPFLVWLKQNAKALFAKYPDVKKHGICAVTWTYSSTDIHINAWEGANNSVTVGFKLGVAGVANVGPQTTWLRGHSSSGWSAWTDQKRVVFFTGVKIGKGILGLKEQHEKGWRGEESFMVEGDEDVDDYRVDVELFGDDWHRIKDT
ncbi:hypothetical protein CC78DRAFT_534135 [Lojkania enalia]|uniref:Uncharacterized protein n=1 Tax=Lojkania enalia TaxID=147567 RepID=A0A9P4N5F2_9PLEO|nr:hypothetical protein CC78DRAFT_534135 [Didymosphaeria enalia]